MANAPVVITNSNGGAADAGSLFEGLRFFLLRRIPMRSYYVTQVEANGGRVVSNEASADYVIADGMRKDCPGGSYSYTFIDEALRTGQLPDPGAHATGAPKIRDVGSQRPPKATRVAFTREDDLLLYNFVQKEKANGASEQGNEIYKRLEAENSRHTFQSWRDRYVRKLMKHPPSGAQVTVPANPPPSPPTDREDDQPVQADAEPIRTEPVQDQSRQEAMAPKETSPKEPAEKKKRVSDFSGSKLRSPRASDFSRDDYNALLQNAADIENIDEGSRDDAWAVWADRNSHHSAGQWFWYWKNCVRPEFLERKRKGETSRDITQEPEQASTSGPDLKRSFTLDDFEKHITSPRTKDTSEDTSDADHPTSIRKGKRKATFEDEDADALDAVQKRRRVASAADTAPYADLDEDQNMLSQGEANPNANDRAPVDHQASKAMQAHIEDLRARQESLAAQGGDDSQLAALQTTTEPNLATSDANHDADLQLLADEAHAQQVIEPLDSMITSEANEAATLQLQQDYMTHGDRNGNDDMIITSEANAAANTQLENELPPHRAAQDDLPSTPKPGSDTTRYHQLQEQNDGTVGNEKSGEYAEADDIMLQAAQNGWEPQETVRRLLASFARNHSQSSGRIRTSGKQDFPSPSRATPRPSTAAASGLSRRRRSSSDRSSQNPPWTAAEEEVVRHGLQRGLNASQIAANLQSGITRSPSSIRSLKRKFLQQDRSSQSQASISPIQHASQDEFMPNTQYADTERDVRDAGVDVELQPGSLLTEANLASQQEQHKPKVNRGIDLEQDDENRDQSDMVSYLEKLLGVKTAPDVIDLADEDDNEQGADNFEPLPDVQNTQDTDATDVTEQQESIKYPELPQVPVTAFPLSSQAEIDDATDGLLAWPNSPVQRRRNQNGSEPGTQVDYPELPPQPEDVRQRNGGTFSSEDSTSRLLSQLNSRFLTGADGPDPEDDELSFTRIERAPSVTGDEGFGQAMEVDAEPQVEAPDVSSPPEDELDFDIPPPPGGFESFESLASPIRFEQKEGLDHEEGNDLDDLQVQAPATNVVEISSRASSSSYHSSEPDEPAAEFESQPDAQPADYDDEDILLAQAEEEEEPVYSSQEAEDPFPTTTHAVETQDILNAETQAPDFAMPQPPSSEPDLDSDQDFSRHSSPVHEPQSPIFEPIQSDDEEQDQPEEDTDAFITKMQAEGFSGKAIIRALERTSEHHELARLVLLDEKLGKGLPKGIPQIWSEEEDVLLMSTDATVLKRLARIKGEEECDARREFLEG